jgi:DNA adenine methylase
MRVVPFLKWVGGKTSIIDTLLDTFPDDIIEYHEPFLGGGSVLIALLQSNKLSKNAKVYCYDINEALIYCYLNIQNKLEELVSKLRVLDKQYSSIRELKTGVLDTNPGEKTSMLSKENIYYYIRNKYNNTNDKTSVEMSSYFIFLNKTCFRGLYRIGPNGFNVPFGHYKKPMIVDENNMKSLQKLISNVVFQAACYKESFQQIKNNSWVYLDPPYAPISKTSFVKYTTNSFNHQEFFDSVKALSCHVVMSNSNASIVFENFKEYTINTLQAPRRINSKEPGAIQEEVIITKF